MRQRCDWHDNPIPHLMSSCLPAGCGHYKLPLPAVEHLRSFPLSPGSLLSHRSLGGSSNLRFSVYILSAGPQGFSPFSSPNTRSGYPLPFPPPTFPPRSLPPSSLVIAFFSFPSGTEVSSVGHFSLLSLLNSVGLYLMYSVCWFWGFFVFVLLANIHILVST